MGGRKQGMNHVHPVLFKQRVPGLRPPRRVSLGMTPKTKASVGCPPALQLVGCRARRRSRLRLYNYSKIRIAAAMTVVQRPRLLPTAVWVMFAVRTILLERR